MESIYQAIQKTFHGATNCNPDAREENWKSVLPGVRHRMNLANLDGEPSGFDVITAKMICRETANGKGIILYGNVGSGKTVRLEYLAIECGFTVFQAGSFGEEWKSAGGNDYDLREFSRCNVPRWDTGTPLELIEIGIDDLGTESTEYNSFGNRVDVMRDLIIPWRETLFPQFKTHFTTNLSPENLRERYGERCWSRLNRMCAFVPLTHPDRRLEK